MTASGPTKKQTTLINQLIDLDMERNELVEKFLQEHGMARMSEMSVKEASGLIDILKSVKPENSNASTTDQWNVSVKQVSFIENLQINDARKSHVHDFLETRGKKTLQELSQREASELISDLKSVPAMGAGYKRSFPATSKQLKFIMDLRKYPHNEEILLNYLKKVRKGTVEELLSMEAGELISLLTNRLR